MKDFRSFQFLTGHDFIGLLLWRIHEEDCQTGNFGSLVLSTAGLGMAVRGRGVVADSLNLPPKLFSDFKACQFLIQ